MRSLIAEKFKTINKLRLFAWLAGVSLEMALRVSIVKVWNWIVSEDFNMLIFGEDQLGYMKGLVAVTLLLIFFNKSNPILSIDTTKQ